MKGSSKKEKGLTDTDNSVIAVGGGRKVDGGGRGYKGLRDNEEKN